MTRRSILNKTVLPIFLVQIAADSVQNELLKINNLLHRAVTWEKLIKKKQLNTEDASESDMQPATVIFHIDA